jgi:hypothetical protein
MRTVRHFQPDTNILDLPILFQGTEESCHLYCRMFNYEWHKDDSVFGGYYAHSDGDCFLIV